MRVGIVFGCFIPMHKGHNLLIKTAKRENDHVIVAVCGHTTDRGQNFISFKDRCSLIYEKYRYDEQVTVCFVDDDLCGCDGSFTLDNWKRWSDLLFTNAQFDPNDPINTYCWYTGDQNYVQSLKQLWPKHFYLLFDRGVYPISGTKVREDPKRYRNEIDPVFEEFLEDKGVLK